MISSRRRPTAAAAVLLVLLFADGNHNICIYVLLENVLLTMEKRSSPTANCDNHIPSLNEISRINDPVLKEVFSSSGLHKQGTRSQYEDRPRLPEPGPPQPQVEPYYGEVPIDHQQPLGPVPHQQRPDAVSMVVDTGVNAFATGANALYRGAASVGQAFGINTQSYEAPLFSAASQFLGRK